MRRSSRLRKSESTAKPATIPTASQAAGVTLPPWAEVALVVFWMLEICAAVGLLQRPQVRDAAVDRAGDVPEELRRPPERSPVR